MIPLDPWTAWGRTMEPYWHEIPVWIWIALTKSLPTMNNGSLHCLSRTVGFVVPARLISVAVNVKFPKRGTSTPLPFCICLATYWPKALQIVLVFCSSRMEVSTVDLPVRFCYFFKALKISLLLLLDSLTTISSSISLPKWIHSLFWAFSA